VHGLIIFHSLLPQIQGAMVKGCGHALASSLMQFVDLMCKVR